MRVGRDWLALAIVGIGAGLRMLHLDADPVYYDWIGYITDEGRWVHTARSQALHGSLTEAGVNDLHLLLSPLFQLVSYPIFEFAGVDRFTTRLLTALSGIATLLLLWVALRNVASRLGLAAALGVLALQEDLLVLSRIAIPEMTIVAFQLAIYLVIVFHPGSRRWMFVAGVLLAMSAGFKATMLLFVPVFALVVLFMPRASEAGNRAGRWASLLWFSSGFVAPLALIGVALMPCCFENVVAPGMQVATDYAPTMLHFLRTSDPYRIASLPLASPLAPTLSILGIGVWLTAIVWASGQWTAMDLRTRDRLVSAVVWMASYGAMSALVSYFPTRYQVQVVVPMLIVFAIGITSMQRADPIRLMNGFANGGGLRHFFRVALLVFPAAVVVASLLAHVAASLEMGATRLSVTWSLILLTCACTTIAVYSRRQSHTVLRMAAAFPVTAILGWMILEAAGLPAEVWPAESPDLFRNLWPTTVALAGVVSLILARRMGEVGSAGVEKALVAFVVCCLVMFATNLAPAYADPRYSLKQTSQELGELLEGAESIAALKSEGLFNDNSLRYFSEDVESFRTETNHEAEALVVVFASREDRKVLERKYQLKKTYRIFVSPEFLSRLQGGPHDGVLVEVYELKPPPAAGRDVERLAPGAA